MPSTSCARLTMAGRGSLPTGIRPPRYGFAAPVLHLRDRPPGRGRRTSKLVAARKPVSVEAFVKGLAPQAWTRCILRDSTRGPLRVDVAHRRVFVWDGAEAVPRSWHLIVRREVGSPTTLKYSLSNAAPDTPTLRVSPR